LSLQVALRRGYMIKRAETLEKLAQVREVIFDKTGTLTQGEFELLKWVPRAPSPSILSAIWAVESQSEHPIARAFTHELNSYGNDKLHPTEVREKLGWGISAKLGQDSFLEIFRSELPPSNCDGPEDILVNTVDIRWNGSYQATAIFGDRLKADARETLQALKKEKIDCYLLTGDKGESSFSAAQKLGLSSEQFLFQQSPEQKNLFLKSRKFAAMVGDGANDALAMAASHVGIAVKGSMEVSLQAADVYLVKSGVNPVFRVIDLARKSMSIIRRNLYISLIYNLVCGAAALLGYINPLVAAVLMPINSLIVISSSIIGTQDFRPGLELNGHSKLGLTQDIPLDYRTQTA
ncbi:MAG: HAD-IC family P-type ATPase, partial [Bdellovibrionales bacterium]|nr:HAD-IC family P-type ATPase [Bdellovibrionales bacterium]